MTYRIVALALSISFAAVALAAGRRAEDDKLVTAMRATNVKTVGQRAIVWSPPAWPAEKRSAVVASLDQVISRVEEILGRKFDAKTYGRRHIEYFITDSDEVPSHVYGAYEHEAEQGDPPYVFLSGLDSGEAPHIHETVHIVGGRFGSLLLREGVATYVQFAAQPGKMRPLVKMGTVTDIKTLDGAVATLLENPKMRTLATSWIANPGKNVDFESRPERAKFYAVSASFTAFLIDKVGMDVFMRAYASDDPRSLIASATGKSWEHWTNAWLDQFPMSPRA
ncbi:MAG TPA: hypothetical protein VHK90_13165 [Thermoanaerobaculia bacterium]|nr:hypothetical protein [Thermoanaerobaculia bacterium]